MATSGFTDQRQAEAELDGVVLPEHAPVEPTHADAAIVPNNRVGSQARPARSGAIAADSGDSTLRDIGRHVEVDMPVLRAWLADLEHDRATRDEMIAAMVGDGHAYDADEDSTIQQRLAMLAANSANAGELSRSDSLTSAVRRTSGRAGQRAEATHGPTVDSRWTQRDDATGELVGYVELVIRGAGPLDIIAYLMDLNGRHWRSRLDPEVDVRDELREVRSLHHIVGFYEGKAAPFKNRTFLYTMMWKHLSDARFVWCLSPIADHPTLTPSDERNAVRAEAARVRLTVIAQNVTRVEYACTLDLKGSCPAWLADKVALPGLMHECARPAVAIPRC
jgi:hypothetical protein